MIPNKNKTLKFKKILGIIPARGGSKGVSRKNIRVLAEKPLITYTIEEAKKSEYLTRIIVSTDDKKIAEIAREYGAEVPFLRPKKLAEDKTPMEPVVEHALKYLKKNENYEPYIIVLLQPTSPFRKAEDIDSAIDKLLKTDADSVITICEVEDSPYWMYKLKNDRIYPLIDQKYFGFSRRQDLPLAYRPNGAVYVTKTKCLIKEKKLLGKDTRAIVIPTERSIDIDTELDFKFAEFYIKKR